MAAVAFHPYFMFMQYVLAVTQIENNMRRLQDSRGKRLLSKVCCEGDEVEGFWLFGGEGLGALGRATCSCIV